MECDAAQWLQAALATIQGPEARDEDKARFLAAMPRMAAQPRRFQALLTDFAKLCRGLIDADALIAYDL